MNNLIQWLDLNLVQWIIVLITSLLVGFSKTGIGGVMMLAIPLLASEFGGKDSTGIMLPMLIIGDLYAIWYYRGSVLWKKVLTPLPWGILGIVLGAIIGNYLNDSTFVMLIGVIVLICLSLIIYTEVKGKNFVVPSAAWFYILVGILSGFASMIGNAAGPIFSIYLLALGFKKNNYMGCNAWFFFLINVTKLPFQIFMWHNIGIKTLSIAGLMIPVITLGAIIGYFVLKKINEKYFRYLIIIMTGIAAVRLFI